MDNTKIARAMESFETCERNLRAPEVWVVKNSEGSLLKVCSGKSSWPSCGAAKSAIRHHFDWTIGCSSEVRVTKEELEEMLQQGTIRIERVF